MSKIKVNSIEAATGTTITIPSGQTLDISSTTLTLPSTVVTTTGTQTLTNKTIGVSQLTGTLPVTNGGTGLTTLGSASQVLRVNSGATALEFGTIASGANAGEVIQVLSTTKTDKFSINSTLTFTDITGLSVAITPASASNKIFITCDLTGGANVARVAFRLMRDSTAISIGDSAGSRQRATVGATGAASNDHLNASFNFLDSPNTTSSITYKLQMICEDNATINSSHGDADTNAAPMTRGTSTITVMEVKG